MVTHFDVYHGENIQAKSLNLREGIFGVIWV